MPLTDKQKLALEQGIPLRNGVPSEALSSTSLSPTSTPSFQIPPIQPPPDVSTAFTPTLLSATPQEQKQSSSIDRLQEINNLLVGKEPFQAQKEREFGINEDLIKTQGDLDSEFKALVNEQEAAQLAYNYTIPNQQQVQAEGRGITAGGLAPITASELRKNQIYQGELTSRQLGVASKQAAIEGKIATAKTLAEMATKEKYRALESEQKAIQANLDLVIADPKTTLQDKNRALAQKAIQDKKDEEIAKAKETDKAKRDIVIKVAATGKANAEQLNEILNAPNEIEAARLAAPFLQVSEERETQLTEAGGKKLLIDTQTGEIIKDYGSSTVPPIPVTTPTGETAVFGTPEYVVGRLQQTANSKTKPVASEREQLGKFANVVALTQSLMTSLNKTNTDPVFGYLKSQNPYDFDARAINAQVTALVPSVARALYGEVGVLTDSDIERYLKTLPNIRSTEDQNKFIALMTLGNAKRSYEQTLLNLANSNVNVSGFTDSYRNLVEQVEKLESDLKIDQPQISGEDDAIFDEVVGVKSTGNYFKNLWNSILGR